MANFQDHYNKLKTELGSLRYLFPHTGSAPEHLESFDEYVREYEFDLALDRLCYVLLEAAAAVDTAALQKIENLHNLMNIKDSCVEKLRALTNPT